MSKKEAKELSSASDFIKSYATKEMTLENPKRVIEIQTLPILDFAPLTLILSEEQQLLHCVQVAKKAILSPLVRNSLTKKEYYGLTHEEILIKEYEIFKESNKFSDTDIKQICAEVAKFSAETRDKAAEV